MYRPITVLLGFILVVADFGLYKHPGGMGAGVVLVKVRQQRAWSSGARL